MYDLPPQHGDKRARELKEPTGPQVQSLIYNFATVKPGSNVYGWASINRIDVYESVGEHVAGYDKAYRFGVAPTWGRCIEVRDWSGNGPLWGLEIDVLSKGRDTVHGRRGLGIVLGRNEVGDDRPHYDYGIDVLPIGMDPDEATLGTAYNASVPCENVLSGPPGSWITLDRDKAIGIVFDEQTGWVLYGMKSKIGSPLDRMQAVLAIQVQTGEVMSFGRRIVGPA